MARSQLSIAAAAVVLFIIISFALYGGLTYPRTVVSLPVSFTVGADSKTVFFSQLVIDNKAQVQVTVTTGAALWRARILNGDQVIWEHAAAQGEQQSYESGWIALSSGNYNFTLGTIGVGSLNAQATVSCKGGFW